MENDWNCCLFSVFSSFFDWIVFFFVICSSGYKLSIHTVCCTICISKWLHVEAVKWFPVRALHKFCQSVAFVKSVLICLCSCSFRRTGFHFFIWIPQCFPSMRNTNSVLVFIAWTWRIQNNDQSHFLSIIISWFPLITIQNNFCYCTFLSRIL